MNFDGKALGNKSIGDDTHLKLFGSPAIKAGSLKESKTRFLSSNRTEPCERIKLLLQERLAGIICELI